jgi:signal peptidase II
MAGNRFPFVACLVLALDQISKLCVERCLPVDAWRSLGLGTLTLTHIHNAGVAMGWLEHTGAVVLAASLGVVLCLTLCWASLQARGGALPAPFAVGLACFLGGSAGNTLDRLRLGHVIDFIALPNGLVINLADIAIALGAALVCHALWAAPGRAARLQTSEAR